MNNILHEIKNKHKHLKNPLKNKNWEDGIRKVLIKPCDETEDPLGYKAIFYLNNEALLSSKKKSFTIGASFLMQRAHNLKKAGREAPMTDKAIAMVKDYIGGDLPLP